MLRLAVVTALVIGSSALPVQAQSEKTARVSLSDKPQTVYLYPTAAPATSLVVLSSGDLGWAGFVVSVAEFLQAHGVAVLGFNTRAYLTGFTGPQTTLDPSQVPVHYEMLAHEAQRILGVPGRCILVGVSEGAGLSVAAAADSGRQASYRGVIGLGLPASIELGWNWWKDWTIWITKGQPKQPRLSITPIVGRVSPVPLVLIQSTRDEFVPAVDTGALFAAAQEPKRIYSIDAKNHRFSDRQSELHSRLLDALAWIGGMEIDGEVHEPAPGVVYVIAWAIDYAKHCPRSSPSSCSSPPWRSCAAS